jgi:hypothetical protein
MKTVGLIKPDFFAGFADESPLPGASDLTTFAVRFPFEIYI